MNNAMKNAVPRRNKTTVLLVRKANAVAAPTTGLIIGAANMKAIPDDKGTPFKTKRRTIGTIPQSHTGKIPPSKQAMIMLRNLFLGIILRIVFSETKLLRNAETMTLSSIKGKASITILNNIILKLTTLFQLKISNRLGGILANKSSRKSPP